MRVLGKLAIPYDRSVVLPTLRRVQQLLQEVKTIHRNRKTKLPPGKPPRCSLASGRKIIWKRLEDKKIQKVNIYVFKNPITEYIYLTGKTNNPKTVDRSSHIYLHKNLPWLKATDLTFPYIFFLGLILYKVALIYF